MHKGILVHLGTLLGDILILVGYLSEDFCLLFWCMRVGAAAADECFCFQPSGTLKPFQMCLYVLGDDSPNVLVHV